MVSSDSPNPASPGAEDPSANDASPAPGMPDSRVAELEAEVARLKDQTLRALAEAENTRRRTQRELEENTKYAIATFARDVLPMADNLRRALDGVPADARADEKLNQFIAGIELTERDLVAALERHHIKRVDPLGQPFDHNLHQAVMQVEAADKPAGTVVQVLQSGFTLSGRLLRPAMVVVSKSGGGADSGASVDTTA